MTALAAKKRPAKPAVATENLAEPGFSLEDIQQLGDRAQAFLDHVRKALVAPDSRKQPPRYTQGQLCQMISVDKATVSRRVNNPKDSLPKGAPGPSGTRLFSVEMVREWAREYGLCYMRKPGQKGFVITVGNFKGGVSKTTTAANLALGLSLKGYRVMVIDFDSQGSLTNTFGVQPEFDVGENESFLPLTQDPSTSLRTVIRPTYWPGVDLVPASVELNQAEFFLPVQQASNQNFRFWSVLQDALNRDGIRDEYDYIIIDTPPSMSYLTLNAFWAADGLLVPLPPEGPDFSSAASFWDLFAQLGASLGERENLKPGTKKYKWIKILPTKVDRQKPHTESLLEWIGKVYGDTVMRTEIPSTSVVSVAGAQMGSIYDIARYSGSAKAYQRARNAYDQLVTHIDDVTKSNCWDVKGL